MSPTSSTDFLFLLLKTVVVLVCVIMPRPSCGQTCSTVTTFNAGQLARIPDFASRRERVPQKLLEDDSDVICLQEYWFEKEVDLLVSKVAGQYPYHYTELHSAVGYKAPAQSRLIPKRPCSPSDTLHFAIRILPCGLLACFSELASGLEAGLACVAQKCKHHLLKSQFSSDCFSCITLTGTSILSLLDECKTDFFSYDNQLNSAGLVLLSKKPMTATYKDFFPGKRLTLTRGYIQADIQDLGTVVCTHLSSLFEGYFEYNLTYTSYQEQQKAEVESLDDQLASTDLTLVGDYNTGPVVTGQADPEKNLGGEYPDNYAFILTKGYSSTYLEDDGRCTYCSDNALVDYSNNVIDFVMTRGDSLSNSNGQRRLDSSPPLSDHYGARATVCKN